MGTNFSTRIIFSVVPFASVHPTLPQPHAHMHAHMRAYTRLITLWYSPAVREASFQMCTASCGTLLNAHGALSPEPGAGKRHSHFLPFSTTGFHPGEAGSLGTKMMLPGGAGNSHPLPRRPLSSGQDQHGWSLVFSSWWG